MATALSNIRIALDTKLNGISGKPYIQFENMKDYTPNLGTKYWEAYFRPARTERQTFDGLKKYEGFYQVDINVPLNQGAKILLADSELIYAAFNEQSLTQGSSKIRIQSVTSGRSNRDENWFSGFMEIWYVCYDY